MIGYLIIYSTRIQKLLYLIIYLNFGVIFVRVVDAILHLHKLDLILSVRDMHFRLQLCWYPQL